MFILDKYLNKGHDKIDKGGSLEDKTPLRNNSDRNENKEKDYNRGRPLQDKKKARRIYFRREKRPEQR